MMKQSNEFEDLSPQEQLSALFDGELGAAQATALMQNGLHDEQLLLQWRNMSAISAALPLLISGSFGKDQKDKPSVPSASSQASIKPQTPAANDPVFRWKMLASVALCCTLGVLVWNLSADTASNTGSSIAATGQSPHGQAALGASTSAPAPNSAPLTQAAMIRDPRLDELLAAHKQFSGMSALQQPAGSLLSVSLTSKVR